MDSATLSRVGGAATGSIHFTRTIEIDSPPQIVFASLRNPRRWADWFEGVVVIGSASGDLPREGEWFRQAGGILGRLVDLWWRVTALDPPRQIAYEAESQSGLRLALRITILPASDGSRLEVDCRHQFPPKFLCDELSQEYIRRRLERELASSLHNLRELLAIGDHASWHGSCIKAR